jgi:hypothetical protein
MAVVLGRLCLWLPLLLQMRGSGSEQGARTARHLVVAMGVVQAMARAAPSRLIASAGRRCLLSLLHASPLTHLLLRQTLHLGTSLQRS